jgi:hypothetical protein
MTTSFGAKHQLHGDTQKKSNIKMQSELLKIYTNKRASKCNQNSKIAQ